jgi:phytoene dehydrogenase-like protein
MNATQLAKATKGAAVEELDVLVVGAGFAGLYQLDHLRRLGYNVKVFEAGSDIGGVWYWNCYPGARVDTYGPLYQFSGAELWRDWNYSELYPAVVDPSSARLHELAGRDHRGVAENGDQVALAARFDPQDAEAVLRVVEGDTLDQTGQNLGWRARPGWLHHRP